MKREKSKKRNLRAIVPLLIFFIIGALGGFIMMFYLDGVFEEYGFLISLALKLLILVAAFYVQTIIHELGHLVAGLISGYRFASFRIGSLMIVKSNGKLKIKKHSLAGTGGQCLMIPPPMVDGKLPVVFYNLGGALMNFLTLPICIFWIRFCIGAPWLHAICVCMFVSGLISTFINGIPLKLGMINNDGSNARELYKNEEAMRAFHNQFQIVAETANGVRLKDMPQEWFFMPSEKGMKNSITVSSAVFLENRLMDAGRLYDAKELIDKLLGSETALIGLHKNLLIGDKITIELLRGGDLELVEKLYRTQEFQTLAKQMKNSITLVRIEYAYALLSLRDSAR